MADALWRAALRWEKELAAIFQDQDAGRSLEHAVSQLREAYVNIVFVDLRFALEQDVEGRIWNKHHKIIERYRNILNQFREANGMKKPVELRKLQTAYINFIKQASRFYRGFVQRLVSHYRVLELDWVVRKFHLSIDIPPDAPAGSCDIDTKNNVIRSCHRTLVFLGDLSRYREAPSTGPKNWGPATGYYTLAKKLVPSSGAPHNQLAVIALNEGSNLSATYHLYRALSVAEPFPEAGDNLGLGFRKVLKAHKAGNLGTNLVRKEEQAVCELIALFVRLHAKCFIGKEFSEYEGLESEMLTQLALDLKERTLSNGMLSKLVLINIAAQFYAAERSKERGFARAHASFLRLNITTFTTLHQVFQPELERAVGDKTDNDAQNVSAVGRRMLPGLRLYSTWLRVCHQTLTDQLADTSMSVLIKQLWQTYANTLSLLAATFPVERLQHLEYLLEEDDDTIGFLPFDAINGAKKLNWENESTSQAHAHPNEEMLARILFLLEDGGQLCREENVPITVVNGTITYQEDGILTSTPSIGMNSLYRTSAVPPTYERMGTPDISNIPHKNTFQSREDEYSDDENDVPRAAESVLAHGGTSIIESTAGSETMSIMNRMVDSLVGPREDPSSEDDEEILFSGRRRKKEARRRAAARRDSKDHERHDGIPEMPRMKTPEPILNPTRKSPTVSTPTNLYTAKDLAAIVQNFTATHQPPHYSSAYPQELPTTPTHSQKQPQTTTAGTNSPNIVTAASGSPDWMLLQNNNSPVLPTMPEQPGLFFDCSEKVQPPHPSSYISYQGTPSSWGNPHYNGHELPPNSQGTVFGSHGSPSVFSRARDRE
ncbi:hypothetical protein DFP73DRAFT_548114 [Morchella snyderi]|nr:hypothetical protein DFP73DRAFT_548114 [Morchella snyderi]